MKSFFLPITTAIFALLLVACGPSPKELIADGDEKKNAHDYEGAMLDYSSALTAQPEIYQAWQNRGECQLKLGAYQLAINDFQEVLKRKPDFGAALYNMGLCFLKLKKYPEALQCIEKAAVSDTSIKANTALAECYFYAGKNEFAIRYFNAAMNDTPDSVGLLLGRALANYQLGNMIESESDLNNYLQNGGLSAIAYRQLGLIYLRRSSAVTAADSSILFLEQFKSKVQNMDKESFKGLLLAYYLRGKILMSTGKQVEAMADFSKIIELEPAHAEALLERGKILISIGQNVEGCTDLQNALKNGNTKAEKLILEYCSEIL